MSKITADHLARRACVYVRQSTPGQVQHNLESQRRQYALVDHARSLGWQDIDVIDDDLGISGSGTHRPGFERLLRALCDGQVGAVFSIEASRLARNGRDWHTLLELGSVRQVYFWLDQQQIQLPVVRGPETVREIVWQPARYHAVLSVLKNPVYCRSLRVWA